MLKNIPLKRPVVHGGKTWSEIDFDPSVGALEDFEAAVRNGAPELTALVDLISADGDTPREVARKIRSSDLLQLQEQMASANPSQPSTAPSAEGGDPGAAPQPMRHTS